MNERKKCFKCGSMDLNYWVSGVFLSSTESYEGRVLDIDYDEYNTNYDVRTEGFTCNDCGCDMDVDCKEII